MLLCLQVHTSRQLAVGLVYSFPRLFGMEFCEFLAELHGAPTVDSLFSLSNTEPTVLSWADLKACLLRIGPDNLHTYIPLRQAVCDNITGPSLLF